MSAFARSAHPHMPGNAVSVRVLVAAGVLALHVGAIAWALRTPPDVMLAPDDDVLMVSLLPTAAPATEPVAPLPPPPPLKTERPPVLATERRIEAAPEAPAVTPVVEEAATPPAVETPPVVPPAAAVSAAPASTAAGSEGDSRVAVCPNNTTRPLPAGLLRTGEKASAVFRLNISAEGRVKKVEVKQSSGSAQIDLHGRRQIRDWKCLPKIENDRPVDSWAALPMNFRN